MNFARQWQAVYRRIFSPRYRYHDMQCKVCQMPYGDPRFERDRRTGEPLYYRAAQPDAAGQPYVREIFCGAHHSYLDYLKSNGQEIPEFLLSRTPEKEKA